MIRNALKNIELQILLGAVLILLTGGCRKDSTTFSTYPPSLGEISYLLSQVPDGATTTIFNLKGNGSAIPDTVLTTPGGVRVFLTDTDALLANANGTGIAVSAYTNLQVIVTEVFEKGDLLARGLTTQSTEGQLLDCTGAVNVRILYDGQTAQLRADRYLKIQFPAPSLTAGMQLYYASAGSTSTKITWEAGASNNVFWAEWPTLSGSNTEGYELIAKQLGWVSSQKPVDGTAGTCCVRLPLQFDGDNTRVFLTLKNINALVELEAGPDRQFCADGIPVGYEVRTVTVSKAGPQHWLGYGTTESGTSTTLSPTPQARSEAEVLDFIRGL
jgi:sulfur transfer complex TusBCD TusB component (DsrH family)